MLGQALYYKKRFSKKIRLLFGLTDILIKSLVKTWYNICNMVMLWDYNVGDLKRTKSGRIKILERMINYGPGKEKIKLSEVKTNWSKLNLFPLSKRLFELLIWGKYQSLTKTRKLF